MRLVAYALSAACGCAPVGYSYYQQRFYSPQQLTYFSDPYDNYNPSAWGGDSAYPIGYSPNYTPTYYVGAPFQDYGIGAYRPRRLRIQIEAKNHHVKTQTQLAAKKPQTKMVSVPLPRPDPRKRVAHHHYPSKMVAIEEN
jgi:hypothetical protein